MSRRAPALLAALALGAMPLLAPERVAARAADDPDCASIGPDDTDRSTVSGRNTANDELQVAEASRLAGAAPGRGVTVYVVDTDFRGPAAALTSGHGLTAAGIVNGADQKEPPVEVGIAPKATVESRPFYAAPEGEAEEGESTPSPDALAQVLRGLKVGKRTIVLVPTAVRGSAKLTAAIDEVHRAGALIIAPAGDRPGEKGGFLGEYASSPRPGEDAAADVWPAADADVVTVGLTGPAAEQFMLRSSAVDLAAPGVGAVSRGLQGGWCRVLQPSTSWAAAQVAGVAALVWSAHPDDTAARIRARLEGTASGNGDASPLTGFGMVQAVEAIQRPVEGLADEDRRTAPVPRGEVPPERADLLSGTRRDAVWWGLAGAGALAVLLVLRPVLARKRR